MAEHESSELLNDPASPDDSSGDALPPARNQAMNWLARREYSRAELAEKLATREYSSVDIEAALDGLIADNLVCDYLRAKYGL